MFTIRINQKYENTYKYKVDLETLNNKKIQEKSTWELIGHLHNNIFKTKNIEENWKILRGNKQSCKK